MEWRIIIRPHLSRALGDLRLSRDGLLFVLFALRHTLPEQADRFRRMRDPDRPDSLFLFRVNISEDPLWHRLTFGVDDVTAPGYLFVENVAHETRPFDL